VPKISFLNNYPLFPTLPCRGPQLQLGPNRVGAVQTKLVASRLGWRNHMARIVVKTTPDVAAFSGVVCYVLSLYMYVDARNWIHIRIESESETKSESESAAQSVCKLRSVRLSSFRSPAWFSLFRFQHSSRTHTQPTHTLHKRGRSGERRRLDFRSNFSLIVIVVAAP